MGTVYTSTDGAGVGAWAWRKLPTGWTVTHGDTGWRDVGWDDMLSSPVHIRRVNESIILRPTDPGVTAGKPNRMNQRFQLPVGFRGIGRFELLIYGYLRTWGRLLFKEGSVFVQTESYRPEEVRGAGLTPSQYSTDDDWPVSLPGTPAR